MFNMLEIYRSRFTKRMRNRTQKRSNTAYSRADSICMANMNSNVYGIGSILAMGPMPLERPISSSNSSLTTTNSLTNRNAVPSPPKENSSTEKKRIIPIQKILSLETDKFEYIINNLNLCDEDRLLNILTEYFLSKEDVNSFTCSSQTTATSSEESRSSISSHYSLTTTSDEFQARRQNSGKKTLNRCYYASIQAHMALAFKSMDTNYDNKLSMDEFVIGIRATLNESCIRKLCAKSYQTLALSILNNTAVLKRLFRKFDLNDDCFIDFSEFIRTIPIPLCHKRVKVLKEAFEALDIDEDSVLTYYDFDKWFRKNNPSFADRPRNDEKLTKIIISCMVNFNGNLEPLKPITREGFMEYYKVVSSTIMNDAYFDLLIRRIHHLE